MSYRWSINQILGRLLLTHLQNACVGVEDGSEVGVLRVLKDLVSELAGRPVASRGDGKNFVEELIALAHTLKLFGW